METITISIPDRIIQHFYLRLARNLTKCPLGHRTPPVGVIVVSYTGGTEVLRLSGSLVSKKDTFIKKAGTAIAINRLRSATKSLLLLPEVETCSVRCLARLLGLATAKGNYFNSVDWAQADISLATVRKIIHAKLFPRPKYGDVVPP